jgi:hypothetical protein
VGGVVSDDRLRELERRFAATGAVEDEVALVQERLRMGALDDEALRLAAALGVEAAARLRPGVAPALDLLVERYVFELDGKTWVRWNARERAEWPWGAGALRRAAASAAKRGLGGWETFVETSPNAARLAPERPWPDLRLVVSWVLGARACDAELAREVVARNSAHVDRVGADVELMDPTDAFGAIASLADSFLEGEARAAWAVARAAWAVSCGMNAAGRVAVLEAARQEVGAWALGHADPLARWLSST